MGDLLMQRCMDLRGVDKVEAFDLTTDSMCKAFRPTGQKKNAKWRPNCALTSTADAPFHEALRLFRVPQGHTAVRWRVGSACSSLRRGSRNCALTSTVAMHPFYDARRLFRVPQGHAALLRCTLS